MMISLESRIAQLEFEVLRLRRRATRTHVVWIAMVCLTAFISVATTNTRRVVFDEIQAHEIAVVDQSGKVRARMGGSFPEDTSDGRPHHRPATAGFIIYDEEGIERGGYVTQGADSNAMLTLDSKHGQSAMFVAGASADLTTTLELWTKTNRIALRADEQGARMSVSNKNAVVFQAPEITLSPNACSVQRELAKQYQGEAVCQERFTEATCRSCLGDENH